MSLTGGRTYTHALNCQAISCGRPGQPVLTRRGTYRACPAHERLLVEAGEVIERPPLVPLELRPLPKDLPPSPQECPMPLAKCVLCGSTEDIIRGVLCRREYLKVNKHLKLTNRPIADIHNDELVEIARSLCDSTKPPHTPALDELQLKPAEAAELVAERRVMEAVEEAVDAVLPASPDVSVSVTVDVHVAEDRMGAVLAEEHLDDRADAGLRILQHTRPFLHSERLALADRLINELRYPIDRIEAGRWSDLDCTEVADWIAAGANDQDRPGVLTCAIADLAVAWWREGKPVARSQEGDLLELSIQQDIERDARSMILPGELRVTDTHVQAFEGGQLVASVPADTFAARDLLEGNGRRLAARRDVILARQDREWAWGLIQDLEARIWGEVGRG